MTIAVAVIGVAPARHDDPARLARHDGPARPARPGRAGRAAQARAGRSGPGGPEGRVGEDGGPPVGVQADDGVVGLEVHLLGEDDAPVVDEHLDALRVHLDAQAHPAGGGVDGPRST